MHLLRNRPGRAVLSILAMVVAVAGMLTMAPQAADATTGHPAPTPDAPCGVARRAAAPVQYEHVIWIVMENKSYSQIMGSPDAPYINKLAGACGLASNYWAISHPSLPNYIAMTSGDLNGVTTDAGPSTYPLNVPSIFSQLDGNWRGLDESMQTNCEQNNDGNYAVRHNPAVYYTNIRDVCGVKDVPLTETPNLSAKFTFITPDVCDDMHSACDGTGTSGEIRRGDGYLSNLVPKLINSNEYQSGNTVIFLTFDEGVGTANDVVTEVIAPTVTPGTVSDTYFTHYSLLRTTEDMLGLPYIGQAATATSMRNAFGI